MAAPALLAALPLLAGTLAGAFIPDLPLPLAGAALVVGWLAALGAIAGRRPALATCCLTAGFFAAGAMSGARAQRAADRPALLTLIDARGEDRPVHLIGVLREDAAPGANGVSLTVDVTSVDGAAVAGGVRLSVAGVLAASASGEWRAGRTVALDTALRRPLDYRNPGVPSDRARLARQGTVCLGTVKSAALITVLGRGGWASEAAAALRARVRRATAEAVGRWSPASAGVATAILIGDRGGLSAEDERRLQDAGTYHVIAISGGNIALLTALLVALGRAAGVPPRPASAACIGLLAFYGYAAGLAPSVMRATLAGMIYLAARAADHRGAVLNAIGVAAAVAVIVAPLTALDPGFILSFGATFAIVAAVRRLAPPSDPRGRRRARWWVRAVSGAWLAIRMLGAATLCAEIALAPVGARLFGRVSLAGLLLNFVAIPLMSIIQVAGLAAVVATSVWAPIAMGCGWIAHIATTGLLRSAALVDVAPWLVLDMPPPSWWPILAWYGAWTAMLVTRRVPVRVAASAGAAATAIVIVAGVAPAVRVPPPPPGWTRIVFLDVGQGDATLILPASGEPLLVDAGGAAGSSFDLGRRVTLPAVWAFGARRLGALALTHGDPDHIGGAPSLLRPLRPREIWEGVPVPRHQPLQRLRDQAARTGIAWLTRTAGETIHAGSLTLRVLHPPPPDWERPRVRNDDSIVIDARVGGVAILLPGDITQAVERLVAARFTPAPLTIVKAPHHGSAGSSSTPFVRALHPAAVIFSAGRRNPFGHPAPAAVARYRAAGARLFSTADEGAVVLDTDGQHAVLWCPATGRREAFTARER